MKKLKWMILLISIMMLIAGCSSGPKDTVTKAEGKEAVKAMVEEFYDGLAESNPIEMTSSVGGEVSSVLAIDGDKIRTEYPNEGYAFYLFKENGKTYYMMEGEDPTEEDFMFDMYMETVSMNLKMFVTGFFETDEGDEGLTYTAVRTDKTDGTSELVFTVKAETEKGAAEITSTGTKTDGKVTKIVSQQKTEDQTYEYVFEYKYDVTVEIPEHTIKDMSQYYHHIESPFATIGDYIDTLENEEDLFYMLYNDQLIVAGEKDGRQLQLVAAMSEEDYEEYDGLDFEAEDYHEKAFAILRRQVVTDCVDYTDALVPQEELDAYVGQKGTDLLNDGYEGTGWGITEDSGVAYFMKDDMEYVAEIKVPEDFDFDADHEFEEIAESEILSIKFHAPSYSVFPME